MARRRRTRRRRREKYKNSSITCCPTHQVIKKIVFLHLFTGPPGSQNILHHLFSLTSWSLKHFSIFSTSPELHNIVYHLFSLTT
jgi:hypothetical protein